MTESRHGGLALLEPEPSMDAQPLPFTVEQGQEIAKYAALRIWHKTGCRFDLEELANEAWIGMLKVVPRYKPSMGSPTTYFQGRAYFAIVDWMRDQCHLSRATLNQLKSGELGWAPGVVSLWDVLEFAGGDGSDGLITWESSVGKDDPELEACEIRDLVAKLLKQLPPHGRMLFRLYYLEDATMKEIGEAMGLSESRVSQLHSELLSVLQRCLPRLLGEDAPKIPIPLCKRPKKNLPGPRGSLARSLKFAERLPQLLGEKSACRKKPKSA